MDNHIEFSFRLKVSLHLDPKEVFEIPGEGIKIHTEDIVEEFDSRFGRSRNIEVLSDIESAFRFTKLSVFIPDKKPSLPDDRLEQVYGAKVIHSANKFIDAYRLLTKRYAIENLSDLNSLREKLVTRHIPGRRTGMMSITFGPGGAALTPFQPYRSPEEHESLRDSLKNNDVPLHELFLMDAERSRRIGHDIQSLINAVIALEISASSYPYSKRSLVQKINAWLRPHRKFIQHISMISTDKKVSAGKSANILRAIKERNQVVHKGRRTLKGNINQYLIDIRELISLIAPK